MGSLSSLLILLFLHLIQSSSSPIKVVNLGGWLVTEGWITPDLFDQIPINKDLLDGTQINLKSVTQNRFLCAENGGGSIVVANQLSASDWGTFKLWRITEKTFQFRAFKWQFFELNDHKHLIAVSTSSQNSDPSKTFELIRKDNDPNRIRLRAPNGFFLQANSDGSVTADHPEKTNWDDQSTFLLTVVVQLKGEFQVTNAYGHDKASSVMMEHWNSFIVEDDFKFMSENGLNAVKIPVGWWIMFDPNPPNPFVGGSWQTLDKAFNWAKKYNLKVIIDLHAVPGSQNGWDHSGTRDGFQSWGQTDDTIEQAVDVIEFLASRYADKPELYAIELINEPLAPGVTLNKLKKYYEAGYNATRRHTDVHVIMSNRLRIKDQTELIHFASSFAGSVIDVHYYNMFSSMFKRMTVQQNIDYVYNNRASVLNSLMVSNGPLVFVGEWVDEMGVANASKEDYQRFGEAQLDVYGRATFGWSYWTFRIPYNHWSLEWMIKNGYITL
ncbi:hypothetical protein HPP92_005996 [Vanilla planifolia]|uniref:Mannan endo-1,4-beta-mannosidase n=1 Tax=Vanilla planifolia TaxID=51239 RepID=A0A835S0M8_VANPL|nr:hypothetical protein HPP92_005996 [Vanilla planifolia]